MSGLARVIRCLGIGGMILACHGYTFAEVFPGIDVFLSGHTHLVKGSRVGLITNQTGKTLSGEATVDAMLRHPDIQLVALFAPEHGIRGVRAAGEKVDNSVDEASGLPVYSLYGGGDRRPSPIAMDQVDVLVYDIQDVGSRAYTYVWSLAEMMAFAGQQGKRVVVLDRPNPLGCETIDGPITESKWLSFIGLYPVPRVYGLTVGELAQFLNQEHDLSCKLVVIPMVGYRRDLVWRDLGWVWTPPSPNIPSPESAVCFAATGTIGTLGTVHIGIGTSWPFQLVGAPWLDSAAFARKLNSKQLPGVQFETKAFVPERGLFKGERVEAVFLNVTDPGRFWPATTETTVLEVLLSDYSTKFEIPKGRANGFDRATGTSTVREALYQGKSANSIRSSWKLDQLAFTARRLPYLLYK